MKVYGGFRQMKMIDFETALSGTKVEVDDLQPNQQPRQVITPVQEFRPGVDIGSSMGSSEC